MYYRNNNITSVVTLATVEGNIGRIYSGRANFDASILKAFSFPTGLTLTGTYQAPTGYIQADAVTVGNDGSPANANEELYVLENQNNDNTIVKKYNWNFNY
jgi:hypothetical protein